jgi:phage-related protein
MGFVSWSVSLHDWSCPQGSIISSIAHGIEAVISAIVSVVMAIINAIASVLIAIWDFVRLSLVHTSLSWLTMPQFLCLICCDCFRGGRKHRVGKRA